MINSPDTFAQIAFTESCVIGLGSPYTVAAKPDWPFRIYKTEAWQWIENGALRGLVGVERAYVTPVAALFVRLNSRNLVACKIVSKSAVPAREARHDVPAEIRLAAPAGPLE